MRQAANRARNAPALAAENAANKSARASARPLPVSLDLKTLIAPYRGHRRLTLRIENLRQKARLSAGQNNGDNSWSLTLDDLDGLVYFPPDGFEEEHTLAIRVIAKNDGEASTVALIDFRVLAADHRLKSAAPEPQGDPGKNPPGAEVAASALQEEMLALKARLAERDAELVEMRAAGEQMNRRWQQKLEESLSESERAQSGNEALRMAAAKAALQAQYERDLAAILERSQSEADEFSERDAAMLRQLQQELADAKAALAGRDAAQAALSGQLADLRRNSEAEIQAVKKSAALEAAEKLKAAEAAWQTRAGQSLTELAARCQAAETALASARAVAERPDRDAELRELREQLERLRHNANAEISVAKKAAAFEAAENVKSAAAAAEAAQALAEVTARCQAAETALASAPAERPDRDAELAELGEQLGRLRQSAAAEISAAKEAAALEAVEKIKSAAAAAGAMQSLAEVTERCRAAEAALASVRATADLSNQEVQLAELRDQLEHLRRSSAAQIQAAKQSAAQEAAEKLKAAEAKWQKQAAQSLADVTARCQAAESALASAHAAQAGTSSNDDAYVSGLEREIGSLRKLLVDREADLAQLRASLEQTHPAPTAQGPAANWKPLMSRLGSSDADEPPARDHLGRDVAIIFAVVISAVLFWPQIQTLLPDGLFGPQSQPALVQPTLVPAPPPKPERPVATVARGVNLRADPAVTGAVLIGLSRGAQVTLLGNNGNWDHVEFSGADGKTLQGWVFSSYLEAQAGGASSGVTKEQKPAPAAAVVAAPATGDPKGP